MGYIVPEKTGESSTDLFGIKFTTIKFWLHVVFTKMIDSYKLVSRSENVSSIELMPHN